MSNDQKERITAEAIDWVHRLETTPGHQIEDQFTDWVNKSPLHLPEFLSQQKIEAGIRHIRKQRLAQRQAESASAPTPVPGAVATKRRQWTLWATSAATLAVIAPLLIGVWVWQTTAPQMHSTSNAGTDLVLSDGSRVTLYPASQMSARSLAGFSEITLHRGGAQFRVRHRLMRRFQVQAGGALITATGTAFNVLRDGPVTGVYVVEGSVRVTGRLQHAILAAGQSAEVSENEGIIGKLAATPAASLGSRVFENVTVQALAAHVNRQNRVPRIVVEGAARQRRFLRVEGIDGPESLIELLSTYPDIRIDRRGNLATISSAPTRQEP